MNDIQKWCADNAHMLDVLGPLDIVTAWEARRARMIWQPMESAPRDGKTILAWCVHAADPGFEEGGDKLTVYSAHVEGLGKHVDDGPHVLEFGGGFDDRTYEEPNAGWLPDWWFLHGSDFEEPAYPVCWMPVVAPELEDVIQALRKGR